MTTPAPGGGRDPSLAAGPLLLAALLVSAAATSTMAAPRAVDAVAVSRTDEPTERRLLADAAMLAPDVVPARRLVLSVDDGELRALLDAVLARNPELAAARARASAAAQAARGEGVLPDPRLGVTTWLEPPETRVGPQRLQLSASQRIVSKGKRRLDVEAARAAAEAASREVEALEVELVTDARRLAEEIALLGVEEAIVREELALLEHYEEISRSRYASGEGSQQGPLRLQAELTRIGVRLVEIEQRREQLAASLNALAARPAASPVPVAAPVPASVREAWAALPGLDALLAIAAAHRPELEAWDARIEAARARGERAGKARVPDVTAGLSYTFVGDRDDLPPGVAAPGDEGQDVIGLSASFNLPVRSRRIDAGVAEAALRREAAAHEKAAVLNRIERTIAQRIADAASAERRVRLLGDVLAPQSEQAVESVLSAYSTGQADALDLLDAERTAFQVRLGLVAARADRAIAVVRLEGAIAHPLPRGQRPIRDEGEMP